MANKPEIQYVQFFVDGSAAKKLESVAPAHNPKTTSAQTARKPKRKLIFLDPVAIVGIVVSVVMLVMMVSGVNELKQAREQARAMEVCVAQLRLDNRDLRETYDEQIDLSRIKDQALALGMIPASQAKESVITLRAPVAAEETLSLREQVGTFLTSLFA